ncbi:MAG: hypothetical protein IKT27_04835 [Clostridia bacterium]|nr:hypothetical protein [Clostridia bacterium]
MEGAECRFCDNEVVSEPTPAPRLEFVNRILNPTSSTKYSLLITSLVSASGKPYF